MSDDERWVPAISPTLLRGLLGGVAVGGVAVGLVLVELDALTRPGLPIERPAAVLLALPPAPIGQVTSGPAVADGVRPTVIGLPLWGALLVVGWWTTGRSAGEWATVQYGLAGPIRAPHRLLANWLGRGLGRLGHRLRERAFFRATVRNGVAAGAGYGLAVSAVVWSVVGTAAVDPWLATAAGAGFAGCCGTAGGLLRGARGR